MDKRYLFRIERVSGYDEYDRSYIIAKDCKEAMELFKESLTYKDANLTDKFMLAVDNIQHINIEDNLNKIIPLNGNILTVSIFDFSKSTIVMDEYCPG